MAERLGLLLLLGLTASLANLVGGWVIASRSDIRRTILNILVSFGAGFMLSATILEVIPLSLERVQWAAMLILAGYLFVHLVEHTIARHFHFGEETHREEMLKAHVAYSAIAGLVFHAFFDGALIAAGFWVSTRLGILMFLAIFFHKIPEGFTAASIMKASGRGKHTVTMATFAVGLSTLAGVLSISFSQSFWHFALPFSAGVTLYVAASDLIPEVNKESSFNVSVGVFLGVGLFLLSDALLEFLQ
jgi:ZIP family zinc transporter/zinc and cadmium transporter